VRIDRVTRAAVAGREDAHLRGQLRRHINDGLTVVDQPVREVLADTVGALYRPHPLREPASGLQHLGVAGIIGAIPASRPCLTAFVHNLDRGRTLVWIHFHDHCHQYPP